jgi:hypothetical protein
VFRPTRNGLYYCYPQVAVTNAGIIYDPPLEIDDIGQGGLAVEASYHGEPVHYRMHAAVNSAGETVFELIKPPIGRTSTTITSVYTGRPYFTSKRIGRLRRPGRRLRDLPRPWVKSSNTLRVLSVSSGI